MNKIKEVAQKLVTMSLTALPLAALADVAFDPMSREEWERHQEFLKTSSPSSLFVCVLAFLTGVLLITSLFLIEKKCSIRLGSRRELTPMGRIVMAVAAVNIVIVRVVMDNVRIGIVRWILRG